MASEGLREPAYVLSPYAPDIARSAVASDVCERGGLGLRLPICQQGHTMFLLVSQILLNSLEASCASQVFLRYVALNGQGLFPSPQWHKVACGRGSASERGYDRVG